MTALASIHSFAAGVLFAVGGFVLVVPVSASALPVAAHYIDGGCDPHPEQILTHELGTGLASIPPGPFPIDEEILVAVGPGPLVCVPDDGDPFNDFEVSITNLSPHTYFNLFFAADPGAGVGNADGGIEDLAAPGIFGEAFRIDPFGVNPNLVFESAVPDLLFTPGETWVFLLTNFTPIGGGPPVFDSLGVAGVSSGTPPSNASIVALPEPTTSVLLGIGIAALAFLRRRS